MSSSIISTRLASLSEALDDLDDVVAALRAAASTSAGSARNGSASSGASLRAFDDGARSPASPFSQSSMQTLSPHQQHPPVQFLLPPDDPFSPVDSRKRVKNNLKDSRRHLSSPDLGRMTLEDTAPTQTSKHSKKHRKEKSSTSHEDGHVLRPKRSPSHSSAKSMFDTLFHRKSTRSSKHRPSSTLAVYDPPHTATTPTRPTDLIQDLAETAATLRKRFDELVEDAKDTTPRRARRRSSNSTLSALGVRGRMAPDARIVATAPSPYHHGHNPRASLTSIYTEVASIYFDAEVVSSDEDDDEPPISTSSLENALQQAAVLEDHQADIHPSSSTSPSYRDRLPVPAPAHEPSLVGMLRKNVGKDLSSISFGVEFNEPLSLLQRMAEECEYANLLALAARADDSIERLAHIAAFATSQYANARYRTSRKPYNPLLGETFELERPDLGLRLVAEKVDHQPPVIACHADGSGWVYDATSAAKNKLSGMSLEIQPLGKQTVELTTFGERYTWSRPSSYMRNLVAGTKYLETIGDMHIKSSTGERCTLTFHAAGWTGKGNQVTGVCFGRDGSKQAWIDGSWDAGLTIRYGGPKDPPHPLWLVNPWPQHTSQYYGMTAFGMQLNQRPEDVEAIAPSDSRLRPDQRLLEEGELVEADRIKKMLEEEQRQRKAEGKPAGPRWFRALSPHDWQYEGTYWDVKGRGQMKEAAPKLWE